MHTSTTDLYESHKPSGSFVPPSWCRQVQLTFMGSHKVSGTHTGSLSFVLPPWCIQVQLTFMKVISPVVVLTSCLDVVGKVSSDGGGEHKSGADPEGTWKVQQETSDTHNMQRTWYRCLRCWQCTNNVKEQAPSMQNKYPHHIYMQPFLIKRVWTLSLLTVQKAA